QDVRGHPRGRRRALHALQRCRRHGVPELRGGHAPDQRIHEGVRPDAGRDRDRDDEEPLVHRGRQSGGGGRAEQAVAGRLMRSKTRAWATAWALAATLVVATWSLAAAQGWPSRPITMLVPFAAGGSIDLPARRLAAELSSKLGQQIVIENRSGANGNIG